MLRLSLWDVFDSSLNPPTRWSSSLHKRNQIKEERDFRTFEKEAQTEWCALLLLPRVFHTFPLCTHDSVMLQPSQGVGLQTKCWTHHNERDKQLHFLWNGTIQSWQLLKLSLQTALQRQTEARSINLMKWTSPVCRSTTKWQVVASSDPITETQSVK